ncbi:putative basic amino acid antiporter YfcC [Peptoniphilus equinus]|uniref:Basic amino acid antiporter YfcC n=1 Tax=Peptoniphilus equinus TaxID=3016343 RepID=A0ABY7QTJ5_9FIRM|nr:putative basic amino acid antiporter YfcC [Peptoniphilus equinus]WBW50052.1 putative basic amino acid antiporter YfcC [Peptoniphilus equinus]
MKKTNGGNDDMKKDFTKMRTPHTYAIIFCVVIVCWLLTFLIPAGKFTTQDITYTNAQGEETTKTVLDAATFRYAYNLNSDFLKAELPTLMADEAAMMELEVDGDLLSAALTEETLTQDILDEAGLSDDELYARYGLDFYDTSEKLHKTAGLWGTDDTGGFGVLNYLFEGLVSGDKYGTAVGIVAMILVVGGAFGVILATGSIDAGIYAFIHKAKGMEKLALPLLFFLFSLGGATFGMSEEVIPFSMIMVPFVIALGYDSIVAVTVSFVASQVGNAASWMSPFSVAVAQGIAGVPILSGATFRLVMWFIVTGLSAAYMMRYAEKIRKNPTLSVAYETDAHFRDQLQNTSGEVQAFTLGHKLVLFEVLLGLVWIIWGVTVHAYYIPEIASQFFVIGFVCGITGIIFKLNGMTVNSMAGAFQQGAADLAGTAVVVGMAKGILLTLGGSDASVPSTLNTILYTVGNLLNGVHQSVAAVGMYFFQSAFNMVVTSNSGQAALTMPIMAPLSDIVGVNRQIAVLAYQLGAGFVDAFSPVSASLIGILGVAGLDWSKWAKFQVKMQGFFLLMGTVIVVFAVIIGFN